MAPNMLPWSVNAIAAVLKPKQIERAKKLKMVKFVYDIGNPNMIPPVRRAGKVAEVLKRPKNRDRKPFSAEGKEIPWNVAGVGAPKVWKELKITGEGVVVAMLDNGVNYQLKDLRNNIWINPGEKANNGKDDDRNGVIDDIYGFDFGSMRCEVWSGPKGHPHGTWTSSIVAGDGTGGTVTGVAPRAQIMPLRGAFGIYTAGLAFQYAVEMGADIMSMSFSIPNLGDGRGLWRLMSEHATCAGLVLISGAGNFPGQPLPVQIRIPEGIPCVICAGGVTRDFQFAAFTSRGPVEWAGVKFYEDHPMPKGLIKPDVCAFPGPHIGLIHPRKDGYMPKENPRRGNSFSAPHIAGVCALILSAQPELTPWRVKEILEQTARDLPPAGKDPQTGAGMIRAFEAVQLAIGKPPAADK